MKVFPKLFAWLLIVALLAMLMVSTAAAQAPETTPSAGVTMAGANGPIAADGAMAADDAINGIPIILLVIGLTEMCKKLGVKDNWNILVSVGIGIAFGIGYQYYLIPLVGFAAWFGATVYGIFLGLSASGLWKVAMSAFGASSSTR
jgi:hypothetical protein